MSLPDPAAYQWESRIPFLMDRWISICLATVSGGLGLAGCSVRFLMEIPLIEQGS